MQQQPVQEAIGRVRTACERYLVAEDWGVATENAAGARQLVHETHSYCYALLSQIGAPLQLYSLDQSVSWWRSPPSAVVADVPGFSRAVLAAVGATIYGANQHDRIRAAARAKYRAAQRQLHANRKWWHRPIDSREGLPPFDGFQVPTDGDAPMIAFKDAVSLWQEVLGYFPLDGAGNEETP